MAAQEGGVFSKCFEVSPTNVQGMAQTISFASPVALEQPPYGLDFQDMVTDQISPVSLTMLSREFRWLSNGTYLNILAVHKRYCE
jgi:hypothetical protein